MIQIGAQYYRPPFPNSRYWQEDMRRMSESGLHAVQLWVKWAWVESVPGEFNFEDYDRLVETAGKHGLGVVLSTIAAVHPYWIHREEPDSEMIDSFGNKVLSANRVECHFGLTPGGCIDHPGIRERMFNFISKTVERYRTTGNIVGWDVWNELRWNVGADGIVCYCPHTMERFHRWLDSRYGGLDGLNRAWQRRYGSWDEIRPGKKAGSPYTVMMAFQRFITWRTTQHAVERYKLVKGLDPERTVTVHGGQPSVMHGDGGVNTALHRGNDWNMVDEIDGIGTSSFPNWQCLDIFDYFNRIDCTASAAGEKKIWLSEVQGGRSAAAFSVQEPVRAHQQQKWLWGGISRKAEKILFWCWRDEVFGHESAGFGMSGSDGYAAERLDAMCKTRTIIDKYGDKLDEFAPRRPQTAVLFNPESYYLHWNAETTGETAKNAVLGYCRALARLNIPYLIVEPGHLERLEGIRFLFLPRTGVVDEDLAARLRDFVQEGGTIFCESECGAFSSAGIYRYAEDRFTAELTGYTETGRRKLEGSSVNLKLGDKMFELPAKQWITPMQGSGGISMGENHEGELAVKVSAGKGEAILCGAYLGDAYQEGSSRNNPDLAPFCGDFEEFVLYLLSEYGVTPETRAANGKHGLFHAITGRISGNNAAFIFTEDPEESLEITFPAKFFTKTPRDIISGWELQPENTPEHQKLELSQSDWGVFLIVDGD